jgi:hypothetical protein
MNLRRSSYISELPWIITGLTVLAILFLVYMHGVHA